MYLHGINPYRECCVQVLYSVLLFVTISVFLENINGIKEFFLWY